MFMLRRIGYTAAVVMALAGCGSSGNSDGFHDTANQQRFQDYVAGYLAVDSVTCHKTNKTDAECTTSDGNKILVLCKSADSNGSHDCAITRRP